MKKYIFLTAIALSLFSCSNDDENTSQTDEGTSNSFFGLVVDNSTTYEFFVRGNATEPFESTNVLTTEKLVAKDVINGEDVFTVEATTTGNDNQNSIFPTNGVARYQVKDSLGYLVRLDEGILFSSESVDPYLISENDWGDIYGALNSEMTSITTAAGDFPVSANEHYVLDENNELLPGRDRYYYTEGLGVVLIEHSSVNNPTIILEKRLVDYDVVIN